MAETVSWFDTLPKKEATEITTIYENNLGKPSKKFGKTFKTIKTMTFFGFKNEKTSPRGLTDAIKFWLYRHISTRG